MADVAFHSSGSTGTQKVIVRTEASLQADARNLIGSFPEVWGTVPPADGDRPREFPPANGDRPRESGPIVVASVRPDHMYGALWRVRAPALAGVPVEPDTVVSVEQLVAKGRTVCGDSPRGGDGVCPRRLIFVTTPSFLEKAVSHPDFPILKGAFRAIVTSGSPLRRETALAVAEATGVCPLEIYGSTEAGSVAWRRQTDGGACTLLPQIEARVDEGGGLIVDSPFAMSRPFAMGDLAERIDERHFLLKGRADRRVKILERFVSLAEVEAALAAHPFVRCVRVEAFGGDVARLGAVIVPSAAGLAVSVRGGSTPVAAELRAFLRGKVADPAVPRRFRLVREMPANEQGKTTVAAVRSVLGAWCREPAVTEWRATEEGLAAELVFPPDMECFRGHFPGFPILPGVAQLYFLRRFSRQAFADWPETPTYRRLKFQRAVLPGRPVTLRVTRRGPSSFAFSLAGANGPCSSGLVEGTAP